MDENSNEIKKEQPRWQPWPDSPVLSVLKSWEYTRELYQDYLNEIGVGQYEIDEIAVLFPHDQWARDYVFDACKEPGVELFNLAHDEVTTEPFGTQYGVNYYFMRMPSDMRIEAMAITNGFSPLHEAILQNHRDDREGQPRIIHLSFKVPSDKYLGVVEHLDQFHSLSMVQACSSTYGEFSYWNVPSLGPVYLKPRCNNRDRGEFGMPGIGGKLMNLAEPQ